MEQLLAAPVTTGMSHEPRGDSVTASRGTSNTRENKMWKWKEEDGRAQNSIGRDFWTRSYRTQSRPPRNRSTSMEIWKRTHRRQNPTLPCGPLFTRMTLLCSAEDRTKPCGRQPLPPGYPRSCGCRGLRCHRPCLVWGCKSFRKKFFIF